MFWKSFLEHFTPYFSEVQRIYGDYFGALVIFPIVKFIGNKPHFVFQ
jgi:hypothetical protein